MTDLFNDQNIKNVFTEGRKCIVNTDLDGILSGMLLQKFLNWKIVGYSCCCGKVSDNLYLENKDENLKECVFVDLPVCVGDISVIDQHFVLFDKNSLAVYNRNKNKANPNLMRNKVFLNANMVSEYTEKYPFGTVHFILAVLENLKIINKTNHLDFEKKIEYFDMADLILRADRVIGNTNMYYNNCIDWARWLIEIGGTNTQILFNKVINEYKTRKQMELIVENKLISLGCKGKDGDCSNMFANKDYDSINKYFIFLSESLGIKPLPVFEVFALNKLRGERYQNYSHDQIKNELTKQNVFSYAFTSMKCLSLTHSLDSIIK